MIRKPTEKDFREGIAVTAIRGTRKIAVEGGKGIGGAFRRLFIFYMVVTFGFGFLVSFVSFFGVSRWMILIALFAIIARWLGRKSAAAGPKENVGALSFTSSAWSGLSGPVGTVQEGRCEYDIAALVKQAVSLAIAAAFPFLVAKNSSALGPPLMAVAIAMLALSALLLARILGDRTALRFNAEGVTVRGLLGEKRMLWIDAQDVYARKTPMFDLVTLYAVGARQVFVIEGARNRLGGPTRLFIPVTLMGLDREAQTKLVARLLSCVAAGGVAVPAWRTQPAAPTRALDAPAASPTGDPSASFDAEAIRVRNDDERQRLATRLPAPRTTFGRRTGANVWTKG